jgi:hypothetical protein
MPVKVAATLAMRAPAMLLADMWFRGWENDTCYGTFSRYLSANGWWNDQWPDSHITYWKHLRMALQFSLVIRNKTDENLILINVLKSKNTIEYLFLLQKNRLQVYAKGESVWPPSIKND